MFGTMADGHSLHNRLHLCLALRLRNVEVSKRKFDVLLYIQFIYQVEALEHKSDFYLYFFYLSYIAEGLINLCTP